VPRAVVVCVGGTRESWEPAKPRKALVLPPELDMGALKLDDLEFDLGREVARMKSEDQARTGSPHPPSRPR